MDYSQLSQTELENRNFLIRVYGWMASALAVTGMVAWITASSEFMLSMIYGIPFVFWGLLILELLLVGSIAGWVMKMSASMATFLFFLYATVNGLTLSVIFLVYTSGSIASTFFVCAGTFLAMSAYGFFTRRDLSTIGNLCLMGLMGIILASIVNFFLHSSSLDWAITYIGILIFVGLTAYDTQKIKNMNIIGNEGTDEDTKESILGALTLYLDFINLFLKLLRILGKRK